MAILVFENNAILADDIQKNLIAEGYQVLLIRVPNEFPEEEELWQEIELIILDLMMGDSDLPDDWRQETENGLITGYIVYKHMVPNKDIPVLVLTGLKDNLEDKKLLDQVQEGIKTCSLLEKPIKYDQFLQMIRKLLRR